MNPNAELHANAAVFQLQLNLAQAVQYVSRNARVPKTTAADVVTAVMCFHKK